MRHRFLLKELIIKGIRLKYRRSYLGIVWSLIEPLMNTIVLVIVFGTLFNRGRDFSLYIIAGRLIYSGFSSGTKAAATSIRRNASMIKKVYVPKYLYPISQVLFNFVIFLISLSVMVLVQIYSGVVPTYHVWQILPALAIHLVLTMGVGMILSTLSVFFRDIEYLWNVLLTMIMYMCAIFYPIEKLEKSGFAWILKYNPLYCIIDIFRGAVLGYNGTAWEYGYSIIAAAVCLLVGLALFKWKQDEFILHI